MELTVAVNRRLRELPVFRAAGKEVNRDMWEMILAGRYLMIPIGLCSLVGPGGLPRTPRSC